MFVKLLHPKQNKPMNLWCNVLYIFRWSFLLEDSYIFSLEIPKKVYFSHHRTSLRGFKANSTLLLWIKIFNVIFLQTNPLLQNMSILPLMVGSTTALTLHQEEQVGYEMKKISWALDFCQEKWFLILCPKQDSKFLELQIYEILILFYEQKLSC